MRGTRPSPFAAADDAAARRRATLGRLANARRSQPRAGGETSPLTSRWTTPTARTLDSAAESDSGSTIDCADARLGADCCELRGAGVLGRLAGVDVVSNGSSVRVRRRAGRGGVARLARDGIARRASRFGASPRRRVAPARRRRAGPRGVGPADERGARRRRAAESDSVDVFAPSGRRDVSRRRARRRAFDIARRSTRVSRARASRGRRAGSGGDVSPPAVRGARRRSLPASHDPAPRASVCRAVALAADASHRRVGEPRAIRRDERCGETRARRRSGARRVGERGGEMRPANDARRGTDAHAETHRTESRNGTRRAARRERARAARSVRSWRRRRARRRRCGPRSSRRALRLRSVPPRRPKRTLASTRRAWTRRRRTIGPRTLRATRARRRVFPPRRVDDVGRRRVRLAPAMALWATSAGADAVSGGVGSRRGGRASRPRRGRGGGRGRRIRRETTIAMRRTWGRRDVDDRVRSGGVERRLARRRVRAAPGEPLTRVEAEFRASAGRSSARQLALRGRGRRGRVARVAAAFPRLAREYDGRFLLDVDAAATTADAAPTTTAAAEFARVTDAPSRPPREPRVGSPRPSRGTRRPARRRSNRARSPRSRLHRRQRRSSAWGARPDGRGPHGLGPGLLDHA